MIAALIESGRIIDLVLAFVALEAVALIAWRGRQQAVTILCALLPGVCLMLAVRAALTGAGVTAVLWIAASLPAHLIDLWRRRL